MQEQGTATCVLDTVPVSAQNKKEDSQRDDEKAKRETQRTTHVVPLWLTLLLFD